MIGIFGGSFDPIHYGHLAAAERAREELALRQVIFVPNRLSPLKEVALGADHRLAMVKLAIADHPDFVVSDIELSRPGPSYTIDTLHELQANLAPEPIVFICGLDSLLDIQRWHRWAELLQVCPFVAVHRPGDSLEAWARLKRVLGPLSDQVRLLPSSGVALSSTELRHLAAQGRSLRYLVPPSVADYLTAHRLYQG